MKYYLRIEGVNLGNFVYDTQDLSTIRGSGLAILESVSYFDGKNILGFELKKISSGASAGLFEFEVSDNAKFNRDEFCNAVRSELNKEGKVFSYATFAIDVLPFTDNKEKTFQIDREKVLAKNRWQQMQSPRFVFSPFSKKDTDKFKRVSCDVDKIQHAVTTAKFKGDKKEISNSVYYRRKYGFEKKQSFIAEEVTDYFDKNKIKHNFAWDFDDLTFGKKDFYNPDKDKGNLHHKMAVIYLDGNDFGKTQQSLEAKELGKFDKMKVEYQQKFLAGLMERVVSDRVGWQFTGEDEKTGNYETIYQLEILLWGGDEICLVVPAWKGWEVVELFYNETKELKWDEKPLTHSVGIVFCHHNAPIRRIKKLAENLAGLAKDRSRKDNYFAYEILESFDHIGKDLFEHRKKRCPQIEPIDPKVMILDGNKISEITKEIKEVKKFFPRRKLTEIVFNLLDSFDDSTDDRKNIVDDLIDTVKSGIGEENKKKLENFTELFDNGYAAYIHALELWDYVEEEINAES
jgi:hypothetical protein